MNVWCDSSIFGTHTINLDDPGPQPEESESAASVTATDVKCMVTDLGTVTEVESFDKKSFIPAARPTSCTQEVS